MPRNALGNRSEDAEFYVGYLPRAPINLARVIFRITVAVTALVLMIGLVLIFFSSSQFAAEGQFH